MMGINQQIARDNLLETFRRLGLAKPRNPLEDLMRALEAGNYNSNPQPLKIESLEATLKNITFDMNQIKHWKKNDD